MPGANGWRRGGGAGRGWGFLVLDTGLDNLIGQRFYFRYCMLPAALRFSKPSM